MGEKKSDKAMIPSAYGPVSTEPLKWLIFDRERPSNYEGNKYIQTLKRTLIDRLVNSNGDSVEVAPTSIDPRNTQQLTKYLTTIDPDVIMFYPDFNSRNTDDYDDGSASFTDFLSLFDITRTLLSLNGSTAHGLSEKPRRLICATTTAGIHGIPARPLYSAMQSAIEGLVETLALELEPLGHRALLVDIGGGMRRNIGGDMANALNVGVDTTSFDKTSRLIYELGHCYAPPIRTAAGQVATSSVNSKLRWITEEIEDWKFLYES